MPEVPSEQSLRAASIIDVDGGAVRDMVHQPLGVLRGEPDTPVRTADTELLARSDLTGLRIVGNRVEIVMLYKFGIIIHSLTHGVKGRSL